MKKVIVLLMGLLMAVHGHAQNDGDSQTLNILNQEVPNSPAFVLLDAAPETIERPTSARALGLSLVQDLTSDGVLNNIAIEVTPFWLSSNLNRSALNFYGIKADGTQNPFSQLKLFTVSAAHIRSADSITNISVGARATLFEWKREADIEDYMNSYKRIEANLLSDNMLRNEFEKENGPIPKPADQNNPTPEELKAYNDYIAKRAQFLDSRPKEMADSIQNIIKRKPAIAIDVAAAYNHRYYGNSFNNNDFGRFGVWSTTAVSFFLSQDKSNKDYFNLYGFVRYLIEGDNPMLATANDDQFNAFDIGVKGEFEFKKLSIGYEYINRSGDLEGYRSAGTIKYQALKDIYITGTFGNNFETQDDLITLFGIQWGINGENQSVAIPKPGD